MAKPKLVICGASGFIGRNIAEFFGRTGAYDVLGTYLKSSPPKIDGVSMIQADLRRPEQVDEVIAGADIVVQMAATTSGAKDIVARPYIHVTDNAVMNSLIFRAAYEHKVKHVVFPSCSIMYKPSDKPIKESDFNPSDAIHEKYFGAGWTKVYLENVAKFFAERSETKYTVFRHSNVYGPYDKYDLEKSHVFGATITKVMTNTSGVITVWGTGEEERDLLHASDIVRFVDLAIQKQSVKYELVNVGLGHSISVANLVKGIIAASGRDLKIEFDPKGPTIKTKLALDYSLAKSKFGWEPKISLEEGIKLTLDWYKKNIK
jgi:nucleoside-diphosphate-sugar epimerase